MFVYKKKILVLQRKKVTKDNCIDKDKLSQNANLFTNNEKAYSRIFLIK